MKVTTPDGLAQNNPDGSAGHRDRGRCPSGIKDRVSRAAARNAPTGHLLDEAFLAGREAAAQDLLSVAQGHDREALSAPASAAALFLDEARAFREAARIAVDGTGRSLAPARAAQNPAGSRST